MSSETDAEASNSDYLSSNGTFSSQESDVLTSPSDPGYFGDETSENMLTHERYENKLKEVNEAYVNYKVSELILRTYKEVTNESHLKNVGNTLSKIEEQNLIKMRTRHGESINILGLDVQTSNLPLLEQSVTKKEVLEKLQNKIKEMKSKRNEIKEIFGKTFTTATQIASEEDTPFSDNTTKLYEACNSLDKKMNILKLKFEEVVEMMQDLNTLEECMQSKEKDLLLKTKSNLQASVKEKMITISVLKEKIKLVLSEDKDHVEHLKNLRDEAKQNISSLKQKLSNLKDTLDKYKLKCSVSNSYSNMVAEYGATKKVLQHNQLMLAVINETNTSAFCDQTHP